MSNTQKGYQSGFAAAKAIVDNSTFGKYLKVQSNSRALSGTVTKVTGTTITMRTVTEDPFIDPSMRDRTVLLNGSTSLTLITTKNNPKPTSKVTAPIFERETITATDIRIGDSIGIFLTAETIKATQPTALTVQVLPRATTTRK